MRKKKIFSCEKQKLKIKWREDNCKTLKQI